MKIICASSVLCGAEVFSALGDVEVIPEERITRDVLRDADALITRTKTRIHRELLDGTAVRFVGCAVAGIDHIDRTWLDTTDIAWCHAPGCNANSAAEYVITALLVEAHRHERSLEDLTLGVIGVGHIGTRVVEKAMDIGIPVLQNDPPRAAAKDGGDDAFIPLNTLLARSDIISLHVPLSDHGPYATRGMVNHRFFEAMKPGAFLFNTARGEIMDSDAFMAAFEHGMVRQAVLDVWENEPTIRKDVLDVVDIGTPHIAGYSLEGRLNGTRMVYDELCHYLETDPTWPETGLSDDVSVPERVVDAGHRTPQEVLMEMATAVYPILKDDRRLRDGASGDPIAMGRHFVECRRNYPMRREFAAARFQLLHAPESLINTAWELGFQISE